MKVKVTKDGVIVSVYIHPSAKQDRIDATDGIEIHTREPPKGNKANVSVIKMLSRVLGIPRGEISIVRGAVSRTKEIYIHGISPDKLECLMQSSNNK